MGKRIFIESRLAEVAANLVENKAKFIADFVGFSSDSRFTAENAEKFVEFLINPDNHKIGSYVIGDGLKVNIDWANPKSLKDVKLERHEDFYDGHIPSYNEAFYVLPKGAKPEELEAFDEGRDIGFYKLPDGVAPELIEAGSWKFVEPGIYHGPMGDCFEDRQDLFFEEDGKIWAVKIVLKIKKG